MLPLQLFIKIGHISFLLFMAKSILRNGVFARWGQVCDTLPYLQEDSICKKYLFLSYSVVMRMEGNQIVEGYHGKVNTSASNGRVGSQLMSQSPTGQRVRQLRSQRGE